MTFIKSILIAATAFAVAGPAFAGRDQSEIMTQERAAQSAREAQTTQGLAGPVGPQGQVGPASEQPKIGTAPKKGPASYNYGHPSERVRR